MTRIAVVVPVHDVDHFYYSDAELLFEALDRNLRGLDRFLVSPPLLGVRLEAAAEHYDAEWLPLGPTELWASQRTYNALMLSRGFYEPFDELGYTHMLLHQLDAITFPGAHRIIHELAGDPTVDYVGAPHEILTIGVPPLVGNGGFSLRRLDAFLAHLDRRGEWVDIAAYHRDITVNEDIYYATVGDIGKPSVRRAARFAFETNPALWFACNDFRLPAGAHAYRRYNPGFWRALGGVRELALGLEPNRHQDDPLPRPAKQGPYDQDEQVGADHDHDPPLHPR